MVAAPPLGRSGTKSLLLTNTPSLLLVFAAAGYTLNLLGHASECLRMRQSASENPRMPRIASECLRYILDDIGTWAGGYVLNPFLSPTKLLTLNPKP